MTGCKRAKEMEGGHRWWSSTYISVCVGWRWMDGWACADGRGRQLSWAGKENVEIRGGQVPIAQPDHVGPVQV
jgi:hypothetical protein